MTRKNLPPKHVTLLGSARGKTHTQSAHTTEHTAHDPASGLYSLRILCTQQISTAHHPHPPGGHPDPSRHGHHYRTTTPTDRAITRPPLTTTTPRSTVHPSLHSRTRARPRGPRRILYAIRADRDSNPRLPPKQPPSHNNHHRSTWLRSLSLKLARRLLPAACSKQRAVRRTAR